MEKLKVGDTCQVFEMLDTGKERYGVGSLFKVGGHTVSRSKDLYLTNGSYRWKNPEYKRRGIFMYPHEVKLIGRLIVTKIK